MATIRDVAKMAGVSISTVSLALNETGRVSAETYQRIWAAAQAVGYAPNPVAQSLKSGRSRLIGMMVGDISNPFFGRLLKGVERMRDRPQPSGDRLGLGRQAGAGTRHPRPPEPTSASPA